MSEPMDISFLDGAHPTLDSRQTQLAPDGSTGPENPAHGQSRCVSPMDIDVAEAKHFVASHEQGQYTEFPWTLATRGTDHSIHGHPPPAHYHHYPVMTNPSPGIGSATHALPRLQEEAIASMQNIKFQPDSKQENISPGHSGSDLHGHPSGQLNQFAAPQDLVSTPYSHLTTHGPLTTMNQHFQTTTAPAERISSVGAAGREYQMSASAAAATSDAASGNPRDWFQARGSSDNAGGNFPQAPRGPRTLYRPVTLQDRRFVVSNVPKKTSLLEIAYFFHKHAGPSVWGPYLGDVSTHGHFWVFISDGRHVRKAIDQIGSEYPHWILKTTNVQDFHAQSHLDTGMGAWKSDITVKMFCNAELTTDAALRKKWLQSTLECVGDVEDVLETQPVENAYTYQVRYHDARQAFNALMSLNKANFETFSLKVEPPPFFA
ncbi:Meiosis protein MEI2 [Penicillium malachiteum]|nr:Meiosis protein MEI2 [Penicillium malachiteum]